MLALPGQKREASAFDLSNQGLLMLFVLCDRQLLAQRVSSGDERAALHPVALVAGQQGFRHLANPQHKGLCVLHGVMRFCVGLNQFVVHDGHHPLAPIVRIQLTQSLLGTEP